MPLWIWALPIAAIILLLLILTGCTVSEGDMPCVLGWENETHFCNEYHWMERKPIKINLTDSSTIKVATFNLKVFGDSKVADQEVLEILTIVACEFDIMAVQEIRDKEETSIVDYVSNINSVCESDAYKYITSERLGRTTSKEQYGYIYNTDTVSLVSTKQYPDIDDDFEREPFFAQFKVNDYVFALGNFHIKPDDAPTELESIKKVDSYMTSFFDMNNMIYLGDFNADCSYFDEDEYTYLKKYYWVVDNSVDTTVGATDCTYDRIIITEGVKQRYAGEWNVFRFDEILDLQIDKASVSDHYPVWFEINTR
jgi:endonuclease/exonuclease/phosphatase family metal-dependent hydrolase